MLRILICLFSFITMSAMADVKYNLPMEINCLGKIIQVKGVAICAQPNPPEYLKVKIPPSRGQLRVTDCNQDLTSDGNPDDFNTKLEKQGWWIFGRQVRIMNDTPMFPLPQRSYNDCAIVAAVSGEDTGVQAGLIIYDNRNYDSSGFIEMSCAASDDFVPVTKAASCSGLNGAKLVFRVNPKKVVAGGFLLVGSWDTRYNCNLKEERKLTGDPALDLISTKIDTGPCILEVAWVKSASEVNKVRILTSGKAREDRELDNVLAVAEGDGVKVYKPNGASIVSSELYELGHVLWRSGPHAEDSYVLNPKEHNALNRKTWGVGTVLCHTAYSASFNSFSGTCYKADGTNQEIPYSFK